METLRAKHGKVGKNKWLHKRQSKMKIDFETEFLNPSRRKQKLQLYMEEDAKKFEGLF